MEPLGKAISIGIVHFFLQAFAPLLFIKVVPTHSSFWMLSALPNNILSQSGRNHPVALV